MDVIRNTEIKTKIIELGVILKAAIIKLIEILKCIRDDFREFIHYLETDTRGECTLPFDFEDLERIVRCVFPDIVKYYEEKRKPEMSAPLTNDAVLSDNEGTEKTVSETEGGIKI